MTRQSEGEARVHVWEALELTFRAARPYDDPVGSPTGDVALYARFDGPGGERLLLPAFWDGASRYRVRFAPTAAGLWRWTTLPASPDPGLERRGTVRALPWSAGEVAANPNRRGFLRVHASGRFFTYADGTPFYWLGDTLWAAHTGRCDPDEALPRYLEDRRAKGFTLVQLAAGYPTANAEVGGVSGYDILGTAPELYANEGGFPFSRPFDRLNPAYFEALDRRLGLILAAGFVPCLAGLWGQELKLMGVDLCKAYWRYLIARYSAYNVLWAVAGEYFFTPDEAAWREIGLEIDRTDPYAHPTSAHSTAPHSGSRHFQGDAWYDFNLIQVGHVLAFKTFMATLPLTDFEARPVKPTVMSESWYEHHPNRLVEDGAWIDDRDVRFASYVPLLQGCVGQTYGAHGLWSFYDGADADWGLGERPGFWWDELNLPGAVQMTHLKALMQEVPWWALEPHPEWVSTPAAMSAYCAAVPRQVYLVYSAGGLGPLVVFIAEAEGEPYDGRWFDPRAGTWREAEGAYAPYGSGWVWRTVTPDEADWVLLLKRRPAA